MKAISESGNHLDWIHPDAEKREYELRSGDDLLAEFDCGTSTDSALVETFDGSWDLKFFGIANPHVIVRKDSGDKDEARFDSSETEPGVLEFSNGRKFHWESHVWRAEWGWNDSAGNQVVSFKRDFEVGEKHEGSVTITETGSASPHLTALIVIGWYLIILAAETAAEGSP